MDGRADVQRLGGRVVKKVAGCDASRLMVGSLGVFGSLLDITFKLVPLPAAETILCLEMEQAEAIEQVSRWLGLPCPLVASAWLDGVLHVRLAGARAAVEGACKELGGAALDDASATAWWRDLREHRTSFFVERSSEPTLWRLAVPGTTPPLALAGRQLLEWGGAQRWVHGDRKGQSIRAVAASISGHATAFRGGDRSGYGLAPVPATAMQIQSRLKAAFDPDRVFCPGRLNADL